MRPTRARLRLKPKHTQRTSDVPGLTGHNRQRPSAARPYSLPLHVSSGELD